MARTSNKNQLLINLDDYPGLNLKSGMIEMNFYFQKKRFRESTGLKPTRGNADIAYNNLIAIKSDIDKGRFDYLHHFPSKRSKALRLGLIKEDQTKLTEYLQKWIIGHSKECSPETLNNYRQAVNNWIEPELGETVLKELTTADIKAFRSSIDRTNKTINNIMTPLRSATALAYEDGVINRDPCAPIQSLKLDPDEPDPFNIAEMNAISEAMQWYQESKSEHEQVINYFEFILWSGLRTGEAIALEWNDIDFVNGIIRVRKSRSANRNRNSTKTGKFRDVKMQQPAREALERQRSWTALKDHQKVFENPRTLNPWFSDKGIRETDWRKIITKAKVRWRPPYHLRHTFASRMLTAGESLPWISRQLGHSSVLTTIKSYATWIPDSDPNAGNKCVEQFWQEAA